MAQNNDGKISGGKSKDVRRQRTNADYDIDADGFAHTPVPAKQRRMSPSQLLPLPIQQPAASQSSHSQHRQQQQQQANPEGRQQLDTNDPFAMALLAAGVGQSQQQSSTGRGQFVSPAELITNSGENDNDEDAKFYRRPPSNWFPIGFEKFVVVDPFPQDNPKDVYVKIAKYHHKDDGGWQWINSGINLNSTEFTTMMKKMDRIREVFHIQLSQLAANTNEKR
jgi:hypothetical protein